MTSSQGMQQFWNFAQITAGSEQAITSNKVDDIHVWHSVIIVIAG